MASGGTIAAIIIIIILVIGIILGIFFYFKNRANSKVNMVSNELTNLFNGTTKSQISDDIKNISNNTSNINTSNISNIQTTPIIKQSNVSPSGSPNYYNTNLAGQNMTCPYGSVLSQFKLNNTANDLGIYYNYTCMPINNVGIPISMITPQTSNGTGNVNELSNINVKCNPGSAISSMQMTRTGPNLQNNQYNYTCSSVPNMGICINKNTNIVNNQHGSILSLSDLNVKCDYNQVLTQVQLNSASLGTEIYYNYTCCSI